VNARSADERAGFHARIDTGYSSALLYFKVDFGDAR
jgi:hypothetical protein